MVMAILLLLMCLRYCEGDSKLCYVASDLVENAALNKPATQVSTYSIGTASKAVDGDTNPRWTGGSCTHTLWRQGLPLYQWWMVDLEREYRIDSVNITNRRDAAERQRDFDIFVSLNNTFEDDDHMTDDSLCIHVSGAMGSGETRTFTCQTAVFGQLVQIYMVTLDKRDMNMCEVTVRGYPAVCSENQTTDTSPPPPTTSTTTVAVQMTSKTNPATSTIHTTTLEATEDATTLETTTSMWLSTTITTKTTSAAKTPTTSLEPTTDTKVQNQSSPTPTLTPIPTHTPKSSATTTAVTTTTLVTTSTSLTLPGNNTTTTTPTCPCVCGVLSNTTNLTQDALLELVKELAKELTVNKKETSMSKRKLISAVDERQSAETIGFIGVLALCVPVLLIVSFDLINVWSFAKQKKNRIMMKQ